MSQDMPDTCLKTSWTLNEAERLIEPAWIEREGADELAALRVDHTDLAVGDQQLDRTPLVSPADADL